MAVALQLGGGGGLSLVQQHGKALRSSSYLGCGVRTCISVSDGARSLKKKGRPAAVRAVRTEKEDVETKEDDYPSGEWPENFSMLNFEDLSQHLAPTLFKAEAQPSTMLADVMSPLRYSAKKDALLEEIDHYFLDVSGVPVVDDEHNCIGVLSKKDKSKASAGLKSKVSEVMSSPAITLSADKTVSYAAVIMLKNKIHRIPIVNDSNQVIGMVTRTDIFTALEGK